MEKFLLDQTFGTTIQSLRLDILKKFLVPVPSLEEQKKSIDKLNKIKENIIFIAIFQSQIFIKK